MQSYHRSLQIIITLINRSSYTRLNIYKIKPKIKLNFKFHGFRVKGFGFDPVHPSAISLTPVQGVLAVANLTKQLYISLFKSVDNTKKC